MGTMKHVVVSKALWVGILLVGTFWATAGYLPDEPIYEGIHSIRIIVAFVVMASYAGPFFDAFMVERLERFHYLALGVVLSWGSIAGVSLWQVAWLLSGRPEWMIYSDMNSFFVSMAVLAGALHVSAPGAAKGIIPKKNWLLIGIAIGIGIGIGVSLVILRPDLTQFSERIRGSNSFEYAAP